MSDPAAIRPFKIEVPGQLEIPPSEIDFDGATLSRAKGVLAQEVSADWSLDSLPLLRTLLPALRAFRFDGAGSLEAQLALHKGQIEPGEASRSTATSARSTCGRRGSGTSGDRARGMRAEPNRRAWVLRAKTIVEALCAACLLFATACARLLHDPAPSLAPQQRPWLVHCETAESHLPEAPAAPGVRHARWVWAVDALGNAIELPGRLEDGFLVVASDPDPGAKPGMRSLPDLRRACLETLRARNADRPLELGKVRAARHGEEIDVPIVFLPAEPPSYPVRRMVIFGDSLSDTGRLRRRLHVIPAPPYWLGRFSNGPNWVDYLAASSGLSIQTHAYGGAAAALHEEARIAELGAKIVQTGQLLLTGSLERQVDDYLERSLAGGRVQRADRTAYVIWAGANDYIWREPFTGEISTFLNSPSGAEGYRRVVGEVVDSTARQVRKLHAAGATRFLVIGLPDLGKTPIVLQNDTYFAPRPTATEDARKLELASRLSALTAHHNERLRATLDDLADEMPDAHILFQDTAAPVDEILGERTGARYGFELAGNRVRLGEGARYATFQQRCYHGGYLGSTHAEAICDDHARAVFWDTVHPTSYTHCWVAWFVGRTLTSAGWIGPLAPIEEYRNWCAHVASGDQGRRETAWRLSGL
jgi:phospholipase/lecithinase/hemolysin